MKQEQTAKTVQETHLPSLGHSLFYVQIRLVQNSQRSCINLQQMNVSLYSRLGARTVISYQVYI